MRSQQIQLLTTSVFDDWLMRLGDSRAKAKIEVRILRLMAGNPGDVKAVGDGVSEMRVDYGPGYRVYFAQRGQVVVMLLCAGSKASQSGDIKLAKKLAQLWKASDEHEKRDV